MRRSNNQNRKLSLKSDRLSMQWKQTLNWNLINAVNQMLYWLDCKETFHHYIIKMFNKININYQVKVCLPDFGILKKNKKNKQLCHEVRCEPTRGGWLLHWSGLMFSNMWRSLCFFSHFSQSSANTPFFNFRTDSWSNRVSRNRIRQNPSTWNIRVAGSDIGNHKYKTVMLKT